MKTEKKNAVYTDPGKLRLDNGEILIWDRLDLPFGSKVEIVVRYEGVDYLRGSNGVVWATHDLDQAETIRGALDAQGITAVIDQKTLQDIKLYCLKIPDALRIEAAIDFVWRNEDGLKLQPDWHYPPGEINTSYERWIRAT